MPAQIAIKLEKRQSIDNIIDHYPGKFQKKNLEVCIRLNNRGYQRLSGETPQFLGYIQIAGTGLSDCDTLLDLDDAFRFIRYAKEKLEGLGHAVKIGEVAFVYDATKTPDRT